MPPTIPFPERDVPIIGQPKTLVVQHYHTFVMQCQCPAKFVSVIIGGGDGPPCPACGVVPRAQIVDGKIEFGRAASPLLPVN